MSKLSIDRQQIIEAINGLSEESLPELMSFIERLRSRSTGKAIEPSDPRSSGEDVNSVTDLDPWTQSLVGVIRLSEEDPTESYVDYLEEKYR